MAPRRKAPRRRARKSFNISAIEAGTAISLAQSTGASGAVDEMLAGNFKGALSTLESNIMGNKQKITATLAGALVAKALTKGFASGTLAKLGPIRIKA
jgi:ABC-type molybdate transport system permease subunit